MKKAVLWDLGGVILSSPFEAFNRYEAEHVLPTDFIRTVNATNPHENAWALLERSEITIDEFYEAFALESETLGWRVPGADVLRWIEDIPFSETRNYVQRVLENAVVYDMINPNRSGAPQPGRLSAYLGQRAP